MIIKYLTNILQIILTLVGVLISLWLILLSAYLAGLLALAFILLLIVSKFYTGRKRIIISIVAVGIFFATVPISIYEVNNKIQSLASIPRTSQTLNQFSTRDKVSIYGLNVIMGVLTYPIYPEYTTL